MYPKLLERQAEQTELGSITQLAVCLTADPGVASSNPSSATLTFVEIDHEIISTVILPLWLIQVGQLSGADESMWLCTSTG